MKPKHSYSLTEGEPLSDGCKKNECRNERHPVGVESESLRRAELRSLLNGERVVSFPGARHQRQARIWAVKAAEARELMVKMKERER